MNRGDQPAAPTPVNPRPIGYETGMTIREAFAMAALQGSIAAGLAGNVESFAHLAVGFADALLDELRKPTAKDSEAHGAETRG